jgi:arginine/ornithine N-succinyltransferase beta subunit
MQTLVFNTTDKTVKLYEGSKSESKLITIFDDVPTVKCERGYYEVMRKSLETTQPVLRVPISNTNMLIEK